MQDKKEYLGIIIDTKDPEYLSEFSTSLLSGHYLKGDETVAEAFARAATNFCYGDYSLAQRIYDYVFKGWFMFASPVLSNALKGVWTEKETAKAIHYWHNSEFITDDNGGGQPISCFAYAVPDTLKGQKSAMLECADLSTLGGGTGMHMLLRGVSDKCPGAIPFEKVQDAVIGYYKQKGSRRGALAAYLNIDNPDIIEHIRFRVPGGDTKRRSDNRKQFHTAVNLTDRFIDAVLSDEEYDLVCPHTGRVYETLKARDVWEEILETRALTGEPYLLKIDAANRNLPDSQKKLGLKINGSNLCSEILLPTDEERTFVCCLSSLNLEKFDEWRDTRIVEDLIRFLDNVIQWFIDTAPDSVAKAKYSAERERALGLGALGWHSYLQSKMIPFEGGGFGSAIQHCNMIHKLIEDRAIDESKQLAKERGEAPDMLGTGFRNSRLTSIAPNSNSGDIANSSPSIEPWYRNVFIKDTRIGSFEVRNKHLEMLLEGKGRNTDEVWKSIEANSGSVQHLDFLSGHEKKVFKTAMELDQHWIIEQANARGRYICQAQSLNVFFPAGSGREYVNSVHIKFLKSEHIYTMYYYRTERSAKVDTVKAIERVALEDWKGDECVSCQG